ncbi:histidine phosphatase family protein, partial [Calothrix rhizosoleniae]|uniref:histidine phosphatase family protein n=1 Tax=Calothrix rhizosoleniae TaxID=888997 RepID=UPI00190EE264
MQKILQSSSGSLVGLAALVAIAITTGCRQITKDAAGKAIAQTASTKEMTKGELANANFKDKLAGKALLNALKQGGHVIYIRHTTTERDYADQVKADVNNCSTQRVLSEKGWKEAKAIGKAFRKYSIPVGQVISSQYCRAWKTADLAFGKYEKNGDLNFPKAEDYTPQQVAQMKALVNPMLIAVPPKRKNTVIVG